MYGYVYPGFEKIMQKCQDLNKSEADLLYDAMEYKHKDQWIDSDILENMNERTLCRHDRVFTTSRKCSPLKLREY